jgi:nickel transport protein
MKTRLRYIPFLIWSLLPAASLHAHGVQGRIDSGAVVVSAAYDSGEPVRYAKVTISGPDSKVAFQSGNTDRNGRFSFSPDVPGEWTVVVDDGIGHRLKMDVQVDETMRLRSDQAPAGAPQIRNCSYERALAGVAVIFGILGIALWLKARRR